MSDRGEFDRWYELHKERERKEREALSDRLTASIVGKRIVRVHLDDRERLHFSADDGTAVVWQLDGDDNHPLAAEVVERPDLDREGRPIRT